MDIKNYSIVGTWELVQAWDIGDDPTDPTKKTYPWGQPPAGYWVYDKTGHFSLMISQNPALPIPTDPFTGNTTQPGWLSPASPWQVPNELLIETFVTANPYAYFGTYTVEMDPTNPAAGNILHNVFSDVLRVYTNTIQTRPFIFDGPDILNVGTPGSYLRQLKRLT